MMICDIYIIMCLYVLLVFYKHNTAYELGISDCSSDVCSSVLCRRGISGPQRRVSSGSGIPAPAIKRLGKPETSQCILTARANSGLPAPPRSTTEMAGRHWVSQDLSVAGRSEEHTSELQSLMRISYAVFCLKKKKYKQQIATNN